MLSRRGVFGAFASIGTILLPRPEVRSGLDLSKPWQPQFEPIIPAVMSGCQRFDPIEMGEVLGVVQRFVHPYVVKRDWGLSSFDITVPISECDEFFAARVYSDSYYVDSIGDYMVVLLTLSKPRVYSTLRFAMHPDR
jgi:hypothetical protein